MLPYCAKQNLKIATDVLFFWVPRDNQVAYRIRLADNNRVIGIGKR